MDEEIRNVMSFVNFYTHSREDGTRLCRLEVSIPYNRICHAFVSHSFRKFYVGARSGINQPLGQFLVQYYGEVIAGDEDDRRESLSETILHVTCKHKMHSGNLHGERLESSDSL